MHRLHRLHCARSIVHTGLPSIKRTFGLSVCALHPNSGRRPSPIPSDNPLLQQLVQSLPTRPYAGQTGSSKRRKKEKQPRKKKAESKEKRDRATIERARASLADFDAKRTGVIQKLSEGSEEIFSSDVWSTGWGEDALRPGQNVDYESLEESSGDHGADKSARRGPPPHISRHPLAYTHRIEGLLDDVRDPNASSTRKSNSIDTVLEDVESPSEHKPIARLAHGLDRVLFNPGVYWLQDPRSRVYNFMPWLESIPKVTDFAFERITGFIRSSQDTDLHTLAKIHSRPYAGSTSSLTGLLSHIYFLISGGMEVDTTILSRAFAHEPKNFTPGQRMPVSVVLRYNDGVWSIDSGKDGEDDSEKNVLTWMGTLLEKFLTLPESEFKTLLRTSPESPEDEDDRREAYRYAKSDRFLMRSQLDCVDPRLPGTGVFDVKTRAATPIRLDLLNFEENSGYLIRTLQGPLESFEKEYYDLIRSAFLKYSFQARIGNMDGVFVAYHNTARVFGFQYISLEEMDARLFGPSVKDVGLGNAVSAPPRGARIFEKCVKLLEKVMDEIVSVFGERSVKCTIETQERSSKMHVWVEPLEWDAKEGGKGSHLVELKGEEEEKGVMVESKDEEDMNDREQSKNGEPETNSAKEAEPPIVQIEVEAENYIAGEPVRASRAIKAAPDENWVLHWSISRSSLDIPKIRANLAAAKERQFRAWNFPANIPGPEEMEAWWNALDFGMQKNAALPLAVDDAAAVGGASDAEASNGSPVDTDGEDGLAEDGPDVNGGSRQLSFNPKLFRQPSMNIELLRQLSREGREETLRAEAEEEAMGREKVVWGVVEDDPFSHIAPRGGLTTQLVDDASSASPIAQASETGTSTSMEKKE